MGLLEKKERIIDLVLTEQGRKLLAKNSLDFTFFAFGDDGVDYRQFSASNFTGSIDDYVFRDLAFESINKKEDLNNFLFTIENRSKEIPVMTNAVETRLSH